MRFHQYFEFARRTGWTVEASPLISDETLANRYRIGRYGLARLVQGYVSRVRKLVASNACSALWIEKEALPWFPAWMEKLFISGRPCVLDYDDAVFHNYDHHRFGLVRWIWGRRIDKLMASADLVVTGNGYLAQRAREAGARAVVVIPTTVDIARYDDPKIAAPRPDDHQRIVWIGSPSTARYLKLVAEPLAALATCKPFVLRVIGGGDIQLPGVQVENVPWTEASEVQAIKACDVGIMPLADTPWERGKCAYKLIQYMASGLPTVASAVGANVEVTVDGETGFLARDEADWVRHLDRLLGEANLRQRMGQAGRLRVEQNYSLQVVAPRLFAAVEASLHAACHRVGRRSENAPDTRQHSD
jgi:glycosyltransferase involved in cell wall biosynthesis